MCSSDLRRRGSPRSCLGPWHLHELVDKAEEITNKLTRDPGTAHGLGARGTGGRRLGGGAAARVWARRTGWGGVLAAWNLCVEGQPLPTYIKEGVRNLLGQPMGRNKETGVLQELGLPLLLSFPPFQIGRAHV